MKGILLAGGTGVRLQPLTQVMNKHLLPVGKYPMIYHNIIKFKQCGINEIMIISNKEYIGSMANLLGSGYKFGLNFTYKVQEEAGGIAQALGLCKNFVGGESCLVLLGDNIFNSDISYSIENFKKQTRGARVLLYKVEEPERYGIAEIKDNKIISIEEKPKKPKSNCCVTGIYMYDNRVFDIIEKLKPSERGELEITDVNNWYIQDESLNYDILKGWWIDAGTFDSLYKANELARKIELNRYFKNNI